MTAEQTANPASAAQATAKSGSRAGRFVRGLFRFFVYVLALYCVVRVVWRFKGSNQWELAAERNGAQVYTLKQPGSDLNLVRGRVRVRSSLSGAVAWLQDPEACKEVGCSANWVDRKDSQIEYEYFRFKMRPPFKTRDFVLRAHFHQIPSTKEVWAEYAAVPDRVPPNDCCFRVTNMNTTWRFTPVGDGIIEAEYTMNMDWGGYIPDVMSNYLRPRYLARQLAGMQRIMDREKYKNAKIDFVQEPSSPPAEAPVQPSPAQPAPAAAATGTP